MSDQYRTVTAKILGVRLNTIIIDTPRRGFNSHVARSLIHGADERKLSDIICPVTHTFRLMEWKAEELGLA